MGETGPREARDRLPDGGEVLARMEDCHEQHVRCGDQARLEVETWPKQVVVDAVGDGVHVIRGAPIGVDHLPARSAGGRDDAGRVEGLDVGRGRELGMEDAPERGVGPARLVHLHHQRTTVRRRCVPACKPHVRPSTLHQFDRRIAAQLAQHRRPRGAVSRARGQRGQARRQANPHPAAS